MLPGYRDLAPLGRGGYSEVYRAYQEQFDRWVAVKILTFALTDERAQRRFLRECRLAGRLSAHPNIVTVYDAGIDPNGCPFLSMELFPDGSIADVLQARGPFHVADALRIGIALAGALETAHRAGVVHRDVKPANVLMASYGQPALADFGLSVVTERHEASASTEAFTPYHAPPEVLERQSVTPAADVYSLASTVYTMLAGRAAHQRAGDDSIAALLLRILQQDVPPLARPDLPPSLSSTLTAALARDPTDRTPTALAFAQGLQQAQREMGDPVTEPVVMDPTLSAAPLETSFEPAPPGPPPAAADNGNMTIQRSRLQEAPVPALPDRAADPPDPPEFAPAFDQLAAPGEQTVHRERTRPPAPAPLSAPQHKRRRQRRRDRRDTGATRASSRRPVVLAVLGTLVAGALVAGGVALVLGRDGDDGPGPSTTTVATDVAAPPENLEATESPAGVQLDWDGEPTGSFAVLVLSEAVPPEVLPADSGPSLLVAATSLSPGVGYCFAVAHVEAMAAAPQGEVEAAFSPPVCIRGAAEDTVISGS